MLGSDGLVWCDSSWMLGWLVDVGLVDIVGWLVGLVDVGPFSHGSNQVDVPIRAT